MHDRGAGEPRGIDGRVGERGRRAAIAEHRALTVWFDDDHHGAGDATPRPDAFDARRDELGGQAIPGFVAADLPDEPGAATELRDRDRGVRGAPAPVPFCVRRHVRAPYEQRRGAHHDVLDEIADTAHQGFHRLFPSRCAGLLPAMPLTVIDHPLVADRVLTLRDQRTKSVDFRRIAREIASFLAYEATRDLPTEPDEVTTPLGLVRAGRAAVDARSARGTDPARGPRAPRRRARGPPRRRSRRHRSEARRDDAPAPRLPRTAARRPRGPARVHRRPDARHRRFPGHRLRHAPRRGAGAITALCLIAAPEGVERVREAAPDARVFTAALDPKLNEHTFIVPGLGDAGDRLYGAGSA